MKTLKARSRAFSLIEVLVVVAVIGVIAAAAMFGVSRSSEGARVTKLESDVSTINQAIDIYIASGGSFGDLSDPQTILNKLKTVRSQGDQHAGLRNSMVDKRLAARSLSDSEAAGSQKRAAWNGAKKKFVVTTSGAGVKEFFLDQSMANVDFGSETRAGVGVDLDTSQRSWIWAYEDSTGAAPPGPTLIPVTGDSGDDGSDAGDDAGTDAGDDGGDSGDDSSGPSPLSPPTIRPGGGAFHYTEFDLTVLISNSNPGLSTWIMYSVDGAAFAKYTTPLSVSPDSTVSAYVTGDPVLWTNSSTVSETYSREDYQLDPPGIVTSVDQFDADNTEITVSLTNSNPAEISSLEYWLTGQSPDAATAYNAPFILNRGDYPDGVTVYARAVGTEPFALDSSVVNKQLTNSDPEQLQTPIITLSASAFDPDTTTIDVSIANPNPAGSSEIRLAMKTPSGTYAPVNSWSIYPGTFTVDVATFPNGFGVRAYAKSLDTSAWLDSGFDEEITTSFFDVPITGDVLFVLDASSSMNSSFDGQSRFEAVIDEVVRVIPTLPNFVKFNVAMFDGGVHWVGTDANLAAADNSDLDALFASLLPSDGNHCAQAGGHNPDALPGYDLRPANNPNKQAMVDALLEVDNDSGTNYEVGLSYPLQFDPVPTQVIFLTDGSPNGGDAPYGDWVDEAQAVADAGIRVDCVGMELDDDELANLEWLANLTGGTVYTLEEGGHGGGAESGDSEAALVLVQPEIGVSDNRFFGVVTSVTVEISEENIPGTSQLVYWLSGQFEADAAPYNGPFELNASDWPDSVTVFAKAVPIIDTFEESETDAEGIRNEL